MKKNYPVTGKELNYSEDSNILSTTNTKGIITYTNDDFIEVSGFDEEELRNKNHNLVRHPDMPPAAFENLWQHLKAGNSWMGIVKNRCKNGDHYWVDAYVTPILNDGEVKEYQSVRTKPDEKYVKRAEKLYQQISEGKTPGIIKRTSMGIRPKIVLGYGLSMLPLILVGGYSVITNSSAGLLSFLIAALVSLGMGIMVSRAILKPICEAIGQTKAIVDDKLMQAVYAGRTDEVGQLLLAIKMMESESGAIIGRIADSSNILQKGVVDLDNDVALSSKGVAHQYRETQQVATAINEMAGTVHEVARNAAEAASAAEEANRQAAEGKQVVGETIAKINGIADAVENAAGVLSGLEEESQNIGTILDVIRDIAEQTNLLALNAAIEAARAGEQGRGFAVVADEVRTLASRTQESTQEIQEMIERLQQGTRHAVQTMEGGRQQAQEGVEQAARAGNVLEGITNAVSTINDMNNMIASAAEEQSSVAEEIDRNVVTISEVAEMTSENMQHMAETTQDISAMAKRLYQLAEQFREKQRNTHIT